MSATDKLGISRASRFAFRLFTNSRKACLNSAESMGTMSESILCKFGCQPGASWGRCGWAAATLSKSAMVLLVCGGSSRAAAALAVQCAALAVQ